MKKKILIYGSLGVVAVVWIGSLILAYGFILPDRNPVSDPAQQVAFSPAATDILKRSCYDCHSNETRYPWYSYMPFSAVLVAYDTYEGRKKLNFSNFNAYPDRRKSKALEESLETIQKGEMPMKIYIAMHKEAAVSDQDFAVLEQEFQSYSQKTLGQPLETENNRGDEGGERDDD